VAAGLDARTTRTDGVADVGAVDLGYHALPTTLTILRGTTPEPLSFHRSVASLPFTDDPGTLTDPALSLLFYRVDGASNEIGAWKDEATVSERLDFLPSR
jgi:hypothetical protein